jgi:ubiquinone/menaquinone biosynthesis C-methylase UbiE
VQVEGRAIAERSGYTIPGFAADYEAFRPRPPEALLDVLAYAAQVERPRLVVDVGCGTGLSTRAWAGRAERVVGIDMTPAMLEQARTHERENVEYVHAYSVATGLEAGSADIVTCSQSFHWMDFEPTLAEAARILRSGGVFAAYDYDWPPLVHPEVEAAFDEFRRRLTRLRREAGLLRRPGVAKEGHLRRIEESGRFRHVREALLHSVEQGDAVRIVGFAYSLGPMRKLLELGHTEDELALPRLREVTERVLGDRSVPFWFGYRVRLGIK